jgi:hypothetical protein
MFERVRARKTEKGVAVFMRAYGIGKQEKAATYYKYIHEP